MYWRLLRPLTISIFFRYGRNGIIPGARVSGSGCEMIDDAAPIRASAEFSNPGGAKHTLLDPALALLNPLPLIIMNSRLRPAVAPRASDSIESIIGARKKAPAPRDNRSRKLRRDT